MKFVPKHLVNIKGLPLIHHVIAPWRKTVENFIFVLRPDQTEMWRFVPPDSAIVLQEKPVGLAKAVAQAEPFIDDNFMVVLGDCLSVGTFDMRDKLNGAYSTGIGVWKTDNIKELRKSYIATVNEDQSLVVEVKEKPSHVEIPSLCGMGVYFFSTCVFDYIRKYEGPPGGGDLTAVIQNMIDNDIKVNPIFFEGKYVNVGSPGDISLAEEAVNGQEAPTEEKS